MAEHNELGNWGEEVAANYLTQKGYFIRERDWHSGHRDIDIIAADDDVLVFVEVKTRRNRQFGDPEEAVHYKKFRNLRLAINHYVKYKHIDQEIRLDIITVVGTPEGGTPEVEHIQDVSLY
jgi:putative endonuclease